MLAREIMRRCTKSDTGCFEWTGAHTSFGYGRLKYGGRLHSTHRLMAFAAGKINAVPVGSYGYPCVLHTCDNPKCCNPAHLQAGSMAENSQQCVARGRHWTFSHVRKDALLGPKLGQNENAADVAISQSSEI